MSETWRIICKNENGTEQFEIGGIFSDSTRSALVALIREKSGLTGEFILKSGDGQYAQPLPGKNSWSLSRIGLYSGAIVTYATREYTDEEKQQLALRVQEETQLKEEKAARLAEKEKEEKEKEEKEKEEKEHEKELKIAVSAEKETSSSPTTTPLSPEKSPVSPQKKAGFLLKLFGKLGSSKVVGSEEIEIPEELKKMWKDMCQPKGTLSWMLVGYADGKTKKLTLLGSGKGGLAELRLKLDVSAVQFGALRVAGLDKLTETAARAKFVGFTVVGTKLTSPQKTLAVHAKEAFRDLFVGISTQMEISQLLDFTDIQIAKKLLTVSGSHKPAAFDFGDGQVLDVSTLK